MSACTIRVPRPARRCSGCTTSSPAPPATGSVRSRWANPTSSAPSRASRCAAWAAPPWRRCSRTCSDSGAVPSTSVAAATNACTSATSAPLRAPHHCNSATTGPYPCGGPRHGLSHACQAGGGAVRLVVGVLVELLDGRGHAQPAPAGAHELVADVAHGADHLLVLGAQLRPETADVHVDGAGAAEEVVAPDLLEQLGAGEDPARVLGEVLEQLELLVG